MQIFVPRECENETRVAVTPDTVKKFIQLGITIQVESGCGLKSLHTDEDYVKVKTTNVKLERTEYYVHACAGASRDHHP